MELLGRMRRTLATPAFTGSVALLALNDHVLKAAYPGAITGKVSDFAGVFALALLLGAVLGSIPGAALVVIGFTALKVSPEVAEWASPLLGGVTRQDPTDLVALIVVVPAAFVLRRGPGGENTLALRYAAGLAAVMTLTATSCAGAWVVDGFVVIDGDVYARVDRAGDDPGSERWALSEDGGHSWRHVPHRPPGSVSAKPSACVGSRCYRLAYRTVEGRNLAEPWTVEFGFTEEEVRRMESRHSECGAETVELLAIAGIPQAEGGHVVVATGIQGALHRTPAGHWERVAVLDRVPIPAHGPSWLSRLTLAPVYLMIAAPFLGLLARIRKGRGWGGRVFGGVMAASILLLTLLAILLVNTDYTIHGPVISVVTAVVFGLSVRAALRRPRTRLPPPSPPLV